jgi:four helix bundle protein
MAKTFEDLKVFQAATELMVDVYRVTEKYPKTETYGLVSQLRRASIGVLSHIGEGQGRLTWGEWRALLSDARGSLFEIEAQLIASQRLGYLAPDAYKQLRVRTREVGGLLAGFIRYIKKREITAKAARTTARSRQRATG